MKMQASALTSISRSNRFSLVRYTCAQTMERVKRQQSLVLLACIIVCLMIFLYSTSNITADSSVHQETYETETESVIYSRTVKHVTKSLTELGTTPSTNNYMLFFNRVPKSGSEMLVLLITWLQGINGFKHIRLAGGRNGDDRRLSRLGQEEMIEEIKEQSKDTALPTSFDRHVYFTNFSSFGTQQPIYINLIRDPVDKMISRFYYADLKGRTRDSQMFEDCVELENEDCRLLRGHAYDLTIPYFCGHDLWCSMLNDKWALEKAKLNVEKYFKVVGVLENLNETLAVLENKIPQYFNGLQNLYFNELLQPHHNKNKNNPREIKLSTRQKLASSLKLEYEFYRFIKSRLLNQYLATTTT